MASPDKMSENSRNNNEKSNLVEIVYKPTTFGSKTVLRLEDDNKKDTWFLYLTAFIVNLTAFVTGITLSWTSPVIPKFAGAENPFGHPVTTAQEAWIASLMSLGATIGPFTAGYCGDKWGRKKAFLFLATPMLVAYIILSFASTVYWYYIARFLAGIGVGSTFGMVPTYLGEITESHNRGKYGVAVGVFMTFGMFYPFAIGPHLSLLYYSLTCTVPLIVFVVCFTLFIPESPYFLASKGDTETAIAALTKFRRKNYEEIQKEMAEIVKAVKEDRQHKGSIKDLLKNVALKRSLIMGLGLVIIIQFCGINPILAFMKKIFKDSGTEIISPDVCTAIIGCIEILSNGAAIFFVEKMDRKLILHISAAGCAISAFALGIYLHLNTLKYDVKDFYWLPLACMIIYNMFFSIGLGPLSVSIPGEIFPSHVKGIATALTSSSTFLISSIMCFIFPIMSDSMGMAGPFWLFGCFCVLTMLFVHFVLIETRGKTLAEIQKNLVGISRSRLDDCRN